MSPAVCFDPVFQQALNTLVGCLRQELDFVQRQHQDISALLACQEVVENILLGLLVGDEELLGCFRLWRKVKGEEDGGDLLRWSCGKEVRRELAALIKLQMEEIERQQDEYPINLTTCQDSEQLSELSLQKEKGSLQRDLNQPKQQIMEVEVQHSQPEIKEQHISEQVDIIHHSSHSASSRQPTPAQVKDVQSCSDSQIFQILHLQDSIPLLNENFSLFTDRDLQADMPSISREQPRGPHPDIHSLKEDSIASFRKAVEASSQYGHFLMGDQVAAILARSSDSMFTVEWQRRVDGCQPLQTQLALSTLALHCPQQLIAFYESLN